MSIRVVCTGCKSSFDVKDKYAGEKRRCPTCGHLIKVPETEGLTVELPRGLRGRALEPHPRVVEAHPLDEHSIVIPTFDEDQPPQASLLEELRAQGDCALLVRWKPGGAMDFTVSQTDNVTADDREFVILALAAEQNRGGGV